MDLDKYEKLVDNKLCDMSDTQLLKLYKDIDEKVRQDSFNTFIKYNNRDTKIVGDLNEKLNFIQVALTFAHVSKSNPSDIFGTVKPWDNMLYSRLHDKGIQIHPNETHQNSGSFLGGYVKDPKLGRSNWVVSFDLNSLYPSIIMMLNMSYETIRLKSNRDLQDIIEKMLKFEYDTKIAHDKEYTIAANGSMYDKSFIGIIPETMSYLFDTRKRIKREMKDIEREIEKLKSDTNTDKSLIKKLKDKVSAMDALQHAYKILANSGYGAIGNETFRYYKNEIAEGITATGQLSIKYISNEINNFLNEKIGTQGVDYVIANDTDSVVGETNIYTEEKEQNISDFYDENKGEIIKETENNFVVKPKIPIKTLTYDEINQKPIFRNVKYIKKHKVKKRIYEIKIKGKSVKVTEDHGLVVKRNGKLVEVKPTQVVKGDIFVTIS